MIANLKGGSRTVGMGKKGTARASGLKFSSRTIRTRALALNFPNHRTVLNCDQFGLTDAYLLNLIKQQ